MQSTPLSTMISEVSQWQAIDNIGEVYKVRAIDKALQTLRRITVFPWMIRKTTLKVFADVLEYPVASDHDEMFYFDKQNISQYSDTARFFSTSIQQFFEDVNSNRNTLAEIWKDGTKMVGLNYKSSGLGSSRLSDAETAADYTVSNDATAVTKDTVTFKKGNASMRVAVTLSANLATIKNTITAISDSNYKKKYQFRWIYLNSVPTSIELRLQTDDSNYLKTVVTAQFSGEAFKANDWNLVAQDLNTATQVGTFDSTSIASEKVIINGVTTGNYWLDESNLREWQLLDYWYYSNYNVGVTGASFGSKEKFYNDDTGTYTTSDILIGDKEWVDVIECEAMLDLVADIENVRIFSRINQKRKDAWTAFSKKYPNAIPLITTLKYRFVDDFNTL